MTYGTNKFYIPLLVDIVFISLRDDLDKAPFPGCN